MPDWNEEIARRISPLKLDSTRENELIEGLLQHLDDRYQELVSGGATDEDARRYVLIVLNGENLLEQARPGTMGVPPQAPAAPGTNGHNLFTSLRQSLRHALRRAGVHHDAKNA